MPRLAHPYPAVGEKAAPGFGGCQTRLSTKTLRRCGCGLVCALDLLLYLHRCRPACALPFLAKAAAAHPVPYPQYEEAAAFLRRRWLPLVYPFGTTGRVIAWGLNRCFAKYGLPLRARWGVGWDSLFETIAAMLQNDLPVVLAVGQNFPFPWGRHRMKFYVAAPDGQYRSAARTKAHFVNVTAIEEGWMQVSSWGRVYYISCEEYRQYALRHSCRRFCNILYLKEEP